MSHTDRLLFVEEVATICRTTISSVRFWIKTGRLRSIRPGRRRLVWASEVERFLNGKPIASGDDSSTVTVSTSSKGEAP